MNEIPYDEWTQVPNEELQKIGKSCWVYRPSNYTGPLAINGFIKKEINDTPGTPIVLSKEEAKIMWPDKKD